MSWLKNSMQNISFLRKEASKIAQKAVPGKPIEKRLSDTKDRVSSIFSDATEATRKSITNKGKNVSKEVERMYQSTIDRTKAKASDTYTGISNAARKTVLETRKSISSNVEKNYRYAKEESGKRLKKAIDQGPRQSLYKAKDSLNNASSYVADTSKKLVASMDPGKRARRARNRMIFLAMSGIFVYGLSTSIPGGISSYMLERAKIEKERRES